MGSGSSGIKTDAIGSYGANTATAAGALGTMSPIYTQMAQGNMGLTPQQQANMMTSAEQSNGGALGSAVNQGNLMAARTGNVGGYPAAMDAASRGAMLANSNAALNVQSQNAQLQQANRLAGLSGLNGIYGTATGAAGTDLNLAEQAPPSFWQQLGTTAAGDVLSGATSLGTGYAGMKLGLSSPSCWIAAELYGGWGDWRTILTRAWLGETFPRNLAGRAVLALYRKFGKRVAAHIRTHRLSRRVAAAVFGVALRRAMAWDESLTEVA